MDSAARKRTVLQAVLAALRHGELQVAPGSAFRREYPACRIDDDAEGLLLAWFHPAGVLSIQGEADFLSGTPAGKLEIVFQDEAAMKKAFETGVMFAESEFALEEALMNALTKDLDSMAIHALKVDGELLKLSKLKESKFTLHLLDEDRCPEFHYFRKHSLEKLGQRILNLGRQEDWDKMFASLEEAVKPELRGHLWGPDFRAGLVDRSGALGKRAQLVVSVFLDPEATPENVSHIVTSFWRACEEGSLRFSRLDSAAMLSGTDLMPHGGLPPEVLKTISTVLQLKQVLQEYSPALLPGVLAEYDVVLGSEKLADTLKMKYDADYDGEGLSVLLVRNDLDFIRSCLSRAPHRSSHPVSRFEFPPFQGIRVNMMPFLYGDRNSLPKSLRPYYDAMLSAGVADLEPGKVAYITIEESVIPNEGGRLQPQRRGGLHLDAPGALDFKSCLGADESIVQRRGGATERFIINWGGCDNGRHPEHGIYMASTVQDSTLVYPFYIHNHDKLVPQGGVIANGCALKRVLDEVSSQSYGCKPYKLDANSLYHIADITPHESLPLLPGTRRQYFRLVGSEYSAWFGEHSTPNPKGVQPDTRSKEAGGAGTILLKGSKFDASRPLTQARNYDELRREVLSRPEISAQWYIPGIGTPGPPVFPSNEGF